MDNEIKRSDELYAALAEIKRIVYTPTKNTPHKGACDHFQSDFDRIRKIIEQTIG